MPRVYRFIDRELGSMVSVWRAVPICLTGLGAICRLEPVRARPGGHQELAGDAMQTDPDSDMIPAWVDGTLTAVGKLEVHQRGLRHKAVSVFVLCGGDLLIQRRAMGKYHTPGLWANTCCTHPHWNETPKACAHRRLHQELGVQGLTLTYRDQVEYRADVGGGLIEHELVDIFVARVDRRIECRPNPDEVMQTDWITLDNLRARIHATPERFTPWLRIYLQQHAGQIFA